MVSLSWLGFLLSIAALLLLARKSLALAMFSAALVLGVFTLSLKELGLAIYSTLTDPSIVLLAIVVGIIPLIGGALKGSGQMDNLVRNMRIGRKPFLVLAPALLGMLPMPGGALLSAPLVEKGGSKVSNTIKAALNVWFRHILFLIYPLGPELIASAKMANLKVYQVLPYLFPALALSMLLGYYFFLKDIDGEMNYEGRFSLKGLLIPLGIILVAPLLDFLLNTIFTMPVKEMAPLIAVSVSLAAAAVAGRLGLKKLGKIGREMEAWKFALIILGMFMFLNVFKASGTPKLLASLKLSPILLCVVVGFLLGLITGRIQAPASIIIPIFLARFGVMSPSTFAFAYFSIFLGYVLTPIHPCVSLSTEYFQIPMRDFLKALTPPAFLALLATLLLSIALL